MNRPQRHGSSKYICISKFSYQTWKAKTDRTERKTDKSTARVGNLNISLSKIDKVGGPEKWQRNRIGIPPSPLQIYKIIICIWKNSHRISFAFWYSTPDFQKGKPISLEWGGGKDKCKKGDKGVQDRDLQRSHERGKVSTHKGVTGQVREGNLWNLRGQQDRFSEREMEKIHHRDNSKPHLWAEK